MGAVGSPEVVRVFAGILYRSPDVATEAIDELQGRFGRISLKSSVFDFGFTDYYEAEMGPDLQKIFIAFESSIDPGRLAEIKLVTNQIEAGLSVEKDGVLKRRVNIDPGYVDRSKVVLASTKNRSQRIYLNDGIYGEVTLRFQKGICKPLPWTYPDYKTHIACEFFHALKDL